MVDLAATVFRDFDTDGVPSSGKHQPRKSKIREWGAWLEGFISAFVTNGGLIFDTRASLFADLAHGANAQAWVISDANVAYNGIYRKIGASGSGSWTRVADLPYSFIRLNDGGAGTANAIVATSSIPLPGASSAALMVMNVFEANTGPVTIAANGGPAKALKTNSGVDLAAGYLAAGMMVCFVDDGTSFRLLSDVASTAIQAVAVAAAAAALASQQSAAGSVAVAVAAASAASNSVAALGFAFSTATADSDPGNGVFRFNNADPALTTMLFVDNVDFAGNPVSVEVDTWDDSTNPVRGALVIRSKTDATVRHSFHVTGAVTAGAGYRKVPVSYVGGSGLLSNGGPAWIGFSRSGNKGNDGVVASIIPGTGIAVDNTDPAHPIISATGGAGGLPGYVKVADYGTGYAALAAAWAVSKKIICTAGETYDFGTGSALTSSGVDVHIIAPQSKFRLTGTDNIMRLEGGWESIQTVSAVTATTATVSDGTQFAVGNVVKIVDDTALWHFTYDSNNGEFAVIESIAANVLTFTQPLLYTYAIGSNCRLGRIKRARLQLDLGEVYVDGGTADTTTGGVLRIEAFANAHVKIAASRYCERAVVEEISCIGSHITVNLDTSPIAADGYGILATSSEHGRYFGTFGRVRHSVVFIANNNFGTGLTPYGHSAYGVAQVNVYGSGEQAFDFHHGTYKCGYVNSVASKCGKGVSFRGIENYVKDSIIDQCGIPVIVFSQYGSAVSKTNKSRMQNCRVTMTGPASSGAVPFVQASAGGGDFEIDGGLWEYVGGVTTRLFEMQDGGLTLRGGARFVISGGTLNTQAIITEAGATHVTIDDVSFDWTGVAFSSTFQFYNDAVAVTPLLTVRNLRFKGNAAAGIDTAFTGALHASATFGYMHLPNVATLSSAVANASFKPYLVGPAWFATNTWYIPTAS